MSSQLGDGFLTFNIKWMKTVTLWPLETQSPVVLTLNSIYGVLLATSLAIVSLGQIIAIFMSTNISSMASVVDLMTLTTSALFKMVYIKFYRSQYQNLVNKIDSTFVHSDFIGNAFQMSRWLKGTRFYTNFYIFLAPAGLVPLFTVTPYIMSRYFPDPLALDEVTLRPIDELDLGNRHTIIGTNHQIFQLWLNLSQANVTSSTSHRTFPLKCWFPFDVTWSPMYEVVYIWESLTLIGSGLLYLISDSFFFMIIYLISGQLEILKTNLRSIPELTTSASALGLTATSEVTSSTGKLPPAVRNEFSRYKDIEKIMDSAISKCVDFHNDILSVIQDLDRLLRSLIVVDFLHAVISLSFAMLQTVISNSIFEWIKMIVFIAICILHQFCNNFFAEILIQQQMTVAEAAYSTPWVKASSRFKTSVRMMVRQARLPIRISGWKMYKLGLGTFVEFMRLLSSYFLVLQSLHAEESSGK